MPISDTKKPKEIDGLPRGRASGVVTWKNFEDKKYFLSKRRYARIIDRALKKGTPICVQVLTGSVFGLARIKPEGTLMLYYLGDDT